MNPIKRKIFLLIFLIIPIIQNAHSQVQMDWIRSGSNGNFKYISTDRSGNCISYGGISSNNGDYLLIKYNSAGTQMWISTYDNFGQQEDSRGMVIDDSDNVYVTGVSYGVGTNFDYATVKFNSSGVRQWVARYNGVGNGEDRPFGIAIDSFNNIYVTGESITDTTNYGFDILTVKYNSNGVQQWVSRYSGSSYMGSDGANAITVDKSNNIYVTGFCTDSPDEGLFCTIKYNSSGVQQWVAKYDGILSRPDVSYYIKVDYSGNVYVSGISYNQMYYFDFATVKYNSDGVQQWARKYDGSGHFDDRVWGMEIDNIGNVYVMGRSTETPTGYDYTAIKYNANGDQIWISRYNNGLNDIPFDMKMDKSGNIYITGQSDGSGTDDDGATVKFDSSGNQIWTIRYNYSGQSDEESNAIALDSLVNVYIAGRSNSSHLTIKYSQTQTGVNQVITNIPNKFHLEQNYPNPFNPVTNLEFGISDLGFVSLRVYDVLGNDVAVLVNERKNAGTYNYQFPTVNYQLSSGIYFYSLYVDGELIDTKRMVLLK